MKKAYEKPRLIVAEKVEARAVKCANTTPEACSTGPIQSA